MSSSTASSPIGRQSAFCSTGRADSIECDIIAGCDGFHGVSRDSIPPGVLTAYEREYPFAWLGILASIAPSSEELIYCYHERGFALLSMRSPTVSRLYLQVPADERIGDWPDSRIWHELHVRLALDGWSLTEGPVTEKGISAMRSFVVEPMQHGRLFLSGDAAHIVPPTGAKGMNLALRDVSVLASAVASFYTNGDTRLLDEYSSDCLRRVWRAQHFSWWMTSMLHRLPDSDAYQARLQLAQLAYTVELASGIEEPRGELRGLRMDQMTAAGTAARDFTRQVIARLDDCPDPRLRELMAALIRHLHEFAVEKSITEAEWLAGIRFLTDVGHLTTDRRQEFILLSDTLGLSMLVDLINHGAGGGATKFDSARTLLRRGVAVAIQRRRDH